MSEPLNPIAAGVASALKSLRARAGLREERLTDSQPAVGMLSGLSLVNELVGAGVPTSRAIVQAVTDAAKTLEPTYSIVVDVSLALELSASEMADSALYASDLGSRRNALIENWDRVHALRAAPDPGQPPTLRTLRLEVETAALTALAVALTTGTATNGAATAVDSSAGLITSDGSAGVTNSLASPNEDAPPPRLLRSATPLLLGEFQRIATALREAILVEEDGRGWPHDLRQGSHPYTALSTSYAVKALLLIEGFLAADLRDPVKWLRAIGLSRGGYKARSQNNVRPEVTAAVLSTLQRIDGTADFGKQFAVVKKAVQAFERTRPFILSTILEATAQLGCDSGFTRLLTTDLLAARQEFGSLLLWPEKSEANLVAPIPSIAHTARAVRALAVAQAVRPLDQPLDAQDAEAHAAVDQAADWLADQQDLGNVSEVIDRQIGADGVEPSYVRHFTAAWVVKALVSAGLPASHPSVSSAVGQIWDYYDPEAALWKWTNGDMPVWMTLDAVEALRLAALATTISPGGIASSRST
jgi:hypothetical protein